MSGTLHAGSAQAPSIVLPSSRTVGFIKHNALKHRLTIERRLIDAGFAIVKERQMQFNPDSDRDMLEELFGNDAAALGEDPVWIYVLERPRAAEVLQSVMGEEDPEEARINSPNSLRAIYGVDRVNNAFGCAIESTAVDILFASSPVWSPGELPDINGKDYGTIRSVNTAFLAALRQNSTPEENSDAAMYASLVRRGSNPGSATSSVGTPQTGDKSPAHTGKTPFKARPVPATNAPGSVQPRMTKAAALRMGIAIPTQSRRHSLDPGAFQKQYEGNVPGYKRNMAVQVASTAPPAIAPRPTRASQLREGKPIDIPRRQSLDLPQKNFEGVPGHKRSGSIAVASTKPPPVAPRANRSALLRQQKLETPPPSSYMFKAPASLPRSLSTKSSSTSLGGESGSSSAPAPAPAPAPALAPRPSLSRSSSAQGMRSSNSTPTIPPRSNRSAELRAAKMALAAGTPAKLTRA